ncbi:hypothetical protein QC761_304155 [Podospora bellae-mahoneyi]|uniref:Uncharacterized protein n=1 Tax=Podospora bellae-mahoneyi TaxID=2093777 RepID=A0ABR0FLN2_9PEZI|nr:hypothetical protein QC761_304155 [Podospora bellae-mahoneyi]
MRRLLLSRPSSLSLLTTAPQRAFCASAPLSTTTTPSLELRTAQPPAEEPSPSQPEQPKENSEQQPPEPNLPSPYTFPLPLAPTTNHSSLPTFLTYASHTSLDSTSTVYIGTHYEYTAILSLTSLAFTLHRVGGRSDYGIDLLGFWSPIPNSPDPPLRVLAQCKVTKTAKPVYIRELEGAFVGAPPGWRSKGVIGALVAEKTATKGVRDAIGRSKWPMMYIVCSREGVVSQMLWNQRAVEEGGLEGLGVGRKYRVVEDGEQVEEVMLTWRGREVKALKKRKTREKKAE